jgi:glycosyltransferase involved in cell wall biosynthesis
MRTLEVAVLDPKTGGGAIRAATIISLRRRVGVEDCRTLPINPQFYDLTNVIVTKALKSCPPAGSVSLPSIIQKTPLPSSWKILLTPVKLLYRLSSKDYNPDVIISHHDTIDSLRVASLVKEYLGSKSVAILQLPPFYGDMLRLQRIRRSVSMYWQLVISTSKPSLLLDLIYYSYSKLGAPVSTRIVWSSAKRLLGGFNSILAASPSIPLEMGDEWVYRVISFHGIGLDRGELEVLLKFRETSVEPHKPYIVFPARLSISKGLADLLLASALLKRAYPNFKLLLIGSGSRIVESQMRRIISNLGLKDNVVLLGYMRRDHDYWSLRRKAKLTLYPSHVDSFSYTVLESLLLGVPVVAYNIPALKLNYGGVEGLYLVEEGDIEALASKVLEVLERRRVEVGIPHVKTSYEIALEEKTLIEKALS